MTSRLIVVSLRFARLYDGKVRAVRPLFRICSLPQPGRGCESQGKGLLGHSLCERLVRTCVVLFAPPLANQWIGLLS
jgi:hypothetical protein